LPSQELPRSGSRSGSRSVPDVLGTLWRYWGSCNTNPNICPKQHHYRSESSFLSIHSHHSPLLLSDLWLLVPGLLCHAGEAARLHAATKCFDTEASFPPPLPLLRKIFCYRCIHKSPTTFGASIHLVALTTYSHYFISSSLSTDCSVRLSFNLYWPWPELFLLLLAS
jgi:hypothetical protein